MTQRRTTAGPARLLLALAMVLSLAATARAQACGDVETPCQIAEGSYHLRLPDGWDGVTPMPVMLHFHGWGRQGPLIVQHGRIARHTVLRGVLLVAPNGAGRTWRFRDPGTADVAFAEAVLADVARRYPVQAERLYVSGYSFGAAMAWRFACTTSLDVAALFAVSGTLQQDETCPAAPREVRHVHGLDDTVMRFPFGPGADRAGPVALWRTRLGCAGAAAPPRDWAIVPWLTLTRTEWDCATGRVILDIHPGGHFIPHGWLGRQLDEVLGRAPTYP